MTPEDPKQTDSQGARAAQAENQQGSDATSLSHDDPRTAARDADAPKVERWNDSDIDAAVDVLERPSQIPPSVRSSTASERDFTSEPALVEPRSVRFSASAVEKSKRTGSEPPSSIAQKSDAASQSSAADSPTAGNARVLPEIATDTDQSQASAIDHPAEVADDGDNDEATAYFDRSAMLSEAVNRPLPQHAPLTKVGSFASQEVPSARVEGALVVKSAASVPRPASRTSAANVANAATLQASTGGAAAHLPFSASIGVAGSSNQGTERDDTDDADEATRYFERAVPVEPDKNDIGEYASDKRSSNKTAAEKNADEGDEATQFYERCPASRQVADSEADVEEPTSYFERLGTAPDSQKNSFGLPKLDADTKQKTLGPVPEHAGRPSSVSLATGIALLSAETTEPPPVVAVDSTSLPGPLRSKVLPPRPAFASNFVGSAKFEPSQVPAPAPTSDMPIGQMGIAKSATSGWVAEQRNGVRTFERPSLPKSSLVVDAEPMSERFHEAPGGDIDPPTGLTGVTAFSIAPRPGTSGFEDEVWLDPIVVRIARRLVRAAASCSGAGVVLAFIDAWYAHRAAVSPPAFWQLFLACVGLIMPVSVVVAVVVTGLSMLLHPDATPSLGRLPQKLRPSDIRRQARLAVILAVSPSAITCWLFLVARAALPLLGSDAAPPVVGTLLAAVAVGIGLLVAAPVLAVARYFGVRLRQKPPDPVRWGRLGALVGVAPLALAIAIGPTSGAGSAFAVFGVFKRPELDLRAPAILIVVALVGYLLPARLTAIRLGWLALVALLPLGLTVRAATRGLDNHAVALAVERGAPVARMALGTLRRLFDRDHDGFSKYFGGGDCDDHNRRRNPGADDEPENGIDEDCSGSDAAAVSLRTTKATPVELLRSLRGNIPQDLNVILLIVDTMRSDVLHHQKRVTPRLDELADKSANLVNAYAPASYTGKSVGPILIGKHSSETNRDFGHFAAFSKKDTFVQQRLHAVGIRTLSVQGYWYFTQPLYGFDRGFDVVDSGASVSAGYVEGDRSSTSEKLTDRILWQLEQTVNTSGRFFLWSQYTDPHAEYVAHSGFDLGSDMVGKYHGEVAFVDYQIGRIIDFVRAQPWGARTAIVITSDHGEAFGEHGMIRHGFELWEPLVHVPLIVHVPGVDPRQIKARRSLVDLVPTILDLMQVGMPDGTGTDFASGQSILPELLGVDGSDVSRPVLIDMAHGPYTAERQAYIDGDIKLITAMGRPIGLFDLATDPGEKRDLLDDVELRERMVGEYRAFKKAMRIVDVRPR